jgi:hypothetical protein
MKKTYPFNMRIDKDTRNKLIELSEDTNAGMSELVRSMINVTYNKHRKVKDRLKNGSDT